jgi:hypothetical protein
MRRPTMREVLVLHDWDGDGDLSAALRLLTAEGAAIHDVRQLDPVSGHDRWAVTFSGLRAAVAHGVGWRAGFLVHVEVAGVQR